jgi:pimeloyl-ACP methyl ester carboxylesterase
MSAVPESVPARSENSTNVRPGRQRPGRSSEAAITAVRVGLRVAEALPGELAAAWAERLFTTPRRFTRPQRERDLLAGARRLELGSVAGGSGVALAGWRWGRAEDPAVLLVHGWEGRGAQLGAFVAPLVERGFQVVTFDAPAHGESAGASVVLTDIARAIVAAARAAGPLAAIVAHSMGAAATSIAIAHFDLLAHGTPRLVYLAPPAWVSRATTYFARRLGISDELRGELDRRLELRTGMDVLALDGPTIARGMHAPLLVVHDEDDDEVPLTAGRAIAEAWPGARLHATSGLGHRRILRDPGTLATVAEFVGGAR